MPHGLTRAAASARYTIAATIWSTAVAATKWSAAEAAAVTANATIAAVAAAKRRSPETTTKRLSAEAPGSTPQAAQAGAEKNIPVDALSFLAEQTFRGWNADSYAGRRVGDTELAEDVCEGKVASLIKLWIDARFDHEAEGCIGFESS